MADDSTQQSRRTSTSRGRTGGVIRGTTRRALPTQQEMQSWLDGHTIPPLPLPLGPNATYEEEYAANLAYIILGSRSQNRRLERAAPIPAARGRGSSRSRGRGQNNRGRGIRGYSHSQRDTNHLTNPVASQVEATATADDNQNCEVQRQSETSSSLRRATEHHTTTAGTSSNMPQVFASQTPEEQAPESTMSPETSSTDSASIIQSLRTYALSQILGYLSEHLRALETGPRSIEPAAFETLNRYRLRLSENEQLDNVIDEVIFLQADIRLRTDGIEELARLQSRLNDIWQGT